MTVETISGYAWSEGKNARILHAGNRFPVAAYSADSELAGYPASAVDKGQTVDRWRPFANGVSSPDDLSVAADWTPTRMTVGADGQTLDEGADAAATRFITQAFTFTALEWVVGFRIQRQTLDGARLEVSDGASLFVCIVDLRDGSISSTSGGTWSITDLGDNTFEVRGYFTPAAGIGYVRLYGYDMTAGSASYTGTNRTVKVLRVAAHESAATLDYSLFGAQEIKAIGVAGHNLGGSNGRLELLHDSNNDGTFTSYGTVDFTDNSPLMYFQSGITSKDWRVVVSRAILPEIAVLWVGDPLVMQRSFYGGFRPARMNRATEVLGNLSGNGQLLGRSKQRTILKSRYDWMNLTYSWVRANLDGSNGLIVSLEEEPCFLAWRPELTEDVDYVMRAETEPPAAQGVKDLWQFAMTGEVLAYE